jgi:3-oxoacyl-[acyl-carrier protein] reductase
MDMTTLDGKVAVVTGGSRGIGLATADALLEAGASVVITATQQATLDEAVRTLERGSARAARIGAAVADVRDEAQAARTVALAVQQFGGLDILVNNAGIGGFTPVESMAPEEWRRTLDTNLTGVFYCCHAAIPHMKARGGGWILNVSSLAGKNPFVGGAAYCASKAGLNAFTEALMLEVRHEGIRVSCILPGSVRTGFSRAGDGPGTEWKLAPEDVAQVILDLIGHPPRSLPSRVEIRPSRPPRK